jgi:hypothetical protein
MLCPNCSKLSFQHTKKVCLRCQGVVLNTISAICEFCSATDKQCSACLKKMSNPVIRKNHTGGCGSCNR